MGEVALARRVDDIGRARARARHAHVERPIEAEGEAALRRIELHGGDAEVEHHAVDFRETGVARGVVEIGEAIFDQHEPSIRRLHQVRAQRDSALVAIDADDFAIGRDQDRARIAAGAESRVDIDAAVANTEELDRGGAEHGNVVSGSANDSRKAAAARRHLRAPSAARAAGWNPRSALSEHAKAPRIAVPPRNIERPAILAEKLSDFMGYNGH